jgi:hypothetical protein
VRPPNLIRNAGKQDGGTGNNLEVGKTFF